MNKSYLKYAIPAVAVVLTLLVGVNLLRKKDKPQDEPKEEVAAEQKMPVLKLKPEKKDVAGPLHDFFEVVERTYKTNDGVLNVELKRISEGFPEPWTEGMEVGYYGGCCEPGFYLELIDADGDIVDRYETNVVYSRHELTALAELNEGETAVLGFSVNGSENAAGFRIGSSFKVHPLENEEEADEEEMPVDVDNVDEDIKNQSSTSNATLQENGRQTVNETDTDADEEEQNEDTENPAEEKSTWQKVKEKTKNAYHKTKEFTKNTYQKAKRKVKNWLNGDDDDYDEDYEEE